MWSPDFVNSIRNRNCWQIKYKLSQLQLYARSTVNGGPGEKEHLNYMYSERQDVKCQVKM